MSYELLAQALEDVHAGSLTALRAFVNAEHPADMATFLEDLGSAEVWRVLDLMPLAEQAELFGYFDADFQVELAEAAPRAKLARLVTEMNSDDRADLFNELDPRQQEALLPALAQAEREDLRRLAGYADGTVGAIMTSDYAVLTPELTAAEAIDKLRLEAPDKETIYRAYVIDGERKLIGSARLADLILAPARKRVSEIMQANTYAVAVDDHQEEAARRIARYDVIALPVIDAEGRIVGIVTHDDAMDVLAEEATEDALKGSAVRPIWESVSDASPFNLYKARIGWLVVLVFGNIFSGAGIIYFEDVIAANLALLFFLPLLIASGGNAGSQSATLMVRAIATGDVTAADWGRLIGKELLVASALGLTMAAAVSVIGVWRGGVEIAAVVAAAMVLIVIVGSLIGMTLPFLLRKAGFDPATASGPLVTSIADVSGVLIYFAIAAAVLATVV